MSSLFIVDQTEQALVLQFGQVRRVIAHARAADEAAVHRERDLLRQAPARFRAAATKRSSSPTRNGWSSIPIPATASPTRCCSTRPSTPRMAVRARLGALVSGSLRRVLGNVTLQRHPVGKARRDHAPDPRRGGRAKPSRSASRSSMCGIRRADLPEENSQAIYARMQSERQQQAAQYRGEGAEAAQTVRANAERERTVILAEAQREAQESAATATPRRSRSMPMPSARTRSSSPSTARCRPIATRSTASDTSFVLTPEGNFFRFFQGWQGSTAARRRPARPRAGPASARRRRPRRPAERARRDRQIGDPARRPPRRVMRDLCTGLALVLVIEGILYALFPEGMKRVAARATAVPPQVLRAAGLLAAAIGVVIVWLLRQLIGLGAAKGSGLPAASPVISRAWRFGRCSQPGADSAVTTNVALCAWASSLTRAHIGLCCEELNKVSLLSSRLRRSAVVAAAAVGARRCLPARHRRRRARRRTDLPILPRSCCRRSSISRRRRP